jgi:signal transduction histidine kinase/CheY-like chemotaxis protein
MSVQVVQKTSDLGANLRDLQSESLKIIALFVGALGYAWLVPVVWGIFPLLSGASAWVGCGLLIGGAAASYALRIRCRRVAANLLVWGTIGAIGCAILMLQSLIAAFLFCLPIVFASVLFGQLGTVLVGAVACVVTLATGTRYLHVVWYSADIVLPMAVVTLVSAAAWLSQRNLYTALAWAWNGYERARHHEDEVNERRAELRRVLRALDETTHRLERANYMLALARDRAEEARRLKQQFAQTISHELRTPLNLIVGFTESMAQSPAYYGAPLPPAYLRDLSTVHRNARHLQNLVNDVLDLARIDVAQMSLIPEEVDPAQLVQTAVDTARSLVEAHGLELCVEIGPDIPRLWVDPVRIRQVLFNLLNNAARFTDRGRVTVSTYRQEDAVVFSVTDTGVGIAPQDVTCIFEEFQQLDGSSRRRHGGAGLGLTISKRFVELHRGRIWVESELGKGSAFYFSLPVERQEPIDGSAHRMRPGQQGTWDDENILLAVTQSPSAASLLSRYVRSARTVVARDIDQAEHMARQVMPQAVLIDTTFGAQRAVSPIELARSWGLDVPFIACPLPGEEPLRQQLAADGYLIKPVSRQDLQDVLRHFGDKIDRILVVDDDREFVRLVSRMLDDPVRRYQVNRAYSGQQALHAIRHRQPDLILLDLVLPDIDGSQVIDSLRADPAQRHIPVVIVSAQDEIENLNGVGGEVRIAKAQSLMPGEVLQWVQRVLHSATRPNGALRANGG